MILTEQEKIQKGLLTIDLKRHIVTLDKREIKLSHKEFCLLCLFAKHPGWVFTKAQIYENIYDMDTIGDIDNMIFCLIHSLRKKIETDLRHPQYIHTIRGVGYKLKLVSEE